MSKVGREGLCGGYHEAKAECGQRRTQVKIADWQPRHRALGYSGSESKELGMGEAQREGHCCQKRTGERR